MSRSLDSSPQAPGSVLPHALLQPYKHIPVLPILRPGAGVTSRNNLNVNAVAGRVVDVSEASAEAIRKSRTIPPGAPGSLRASLWLLSPLRSTPHRAQACRCRRNARGPTLVSMVSPSMTPVTSTSWQSRQVMTVWATS